MAATVAICTWNRADLLDQTLDGLTRMVIPEGLSWELLVVNNNCTDHTDAVIARFHDRLPLRRIHEPKQGLSNARNAAVAAAQGQYILWTDDDVLVDPQWMVAYLDAFRRWPEAQVFGGKVLPWFEAPPPDWLERHLDRLGRYFALRDFGDDEFIIPSGQNPYGANVAFRAEVLRQYSFNPALGRKGDLLVSGEDAEVIRKIRTAGGTVVWIPSSKVRHFLPLSRMTLAYLRQLHYSNGYYEVGPVENPNRWLGGYPPKLVGKWIVSQVGFGWWRWTRPNSYAWLQSMIRASHLAGRLAATRASARKR